MMDEEFLDRLFLYIDARIDEKIGDAVGRDMLQESIRRSEFEQELRQLVRDRDGTEVEPPF